jgi:dimeric dUTPase (all-alpha-NTP-PPase superfamily)
LDKEKADWQEVLKVNLEKMLVAQKVLDDRIIQERGLEGQDLFPNTVLALQVELAEFANEGRWFKHWSDDKKPRIKVLVRDWFEGLQKHEEYKNPLLEEFADATHFFLSIANQKGWQDALWVYEEQLDPEELEGGLTEIYLEMVYFLNKCYFEHYSETENEKFCEKLGFPKNQYWFRMAWILFLNLGINRFGFTPEQIEQAYFSKNKINHARQTEGY